LKDGAFTQFSGKRTGIPCTSTNLKLTTLIVKQLELFPAQTPTYSASPKLEMSADALHQWKQRIFQHQLSAHQHPTPQQSE